MKIKSRILSIYFGIKNSIKRFPITVLFSVVLAGLLIYSYELMVDANYNIELDNLIKIQMAFGIGILLSLNIDLIKERFFDGNKLKTLISYILGIVILVLYYLLLLPDLEFVSTARYTGIMIFLFIGFFYIPKLNKEENYEYYVIDILSDIGVTVLYSIVLLLGIYIIIFTINSLFDANIDGKFYYYTFISVVFVFGIPFFLSQVPEIDRDFAGYSYSKYLRVLLSFIVIPLISIYTIILYVYFIKILINWEWPKGLVSHLVLWYSSTSVGVIFLINKITDTDRIADLFKKIFPKLVLPILLMMFISIGQRVSQYGITENRYYILALGIWVTAMMVYLSFKKSINTIIIPISLSLIVLISVIGPLSGFTISKFSQNRRLNNILERNNMIVNKEVIKNSDISKKGKKEINNIVYYFNNKHSLKDIKVLSNEFTTEAMENTFGFPYEPEIPRYSDGENYLYLYTDIYNKFIPITDYNYYITISTWEENVFTIENISVNYNIENKKLIIKENGNILEDIDIEDIIKEIYTKNNLGSKNIDEDINVEELSYETENENIKLKIIFNNLSGTKDSDGEILEIEGGEFILFLKLK